MTNREKYEAINALDNTDKKIAVMCADILNWVRIFRSKEVRGILRETRGRLQNSKGYVALISAVDFQKVVLSKKYENLDDEDLAFELVSRFYKKKFRLAGSIELSSDDEEDIEDCLEHVLNMMNNGGFDLDHWYNNCYSN